MCPEGITKNVAAITFYLAIGVIVANLVVPCSRLTIDHHRKPSADLGHESKALAVGAECQASNVNFVVDSAPLPIDNNGRLLIPFGCARHTLAIGAQCQRAHANILRPLHLLALHAAATWFQLLTDMRADVGDMAAVAAESEVQIGRAH